MNVEYKCFPTQLEAKVAAVNLGNAYANELWQILHDACKPFVGMKILKADGGLMANFAKVIDALNLPNKAGIIVYLTSSNYSLTWVVKVSQGATTHGDHNVSLYHEHPVYVGNVDKKVLTELAQGKLELRTDFTVEEIKAKREAYNAAKKVADAALSALYPFGESDR